jgi:hypothetical protein
VDLTVGPLDQPYLLRLQGADRHGRAVFSVWQMYVLYCSQVFGQHYYCFDDYSSVHNGAIVTFT